MGYMNSQNNTTLEWWTEKPERQAKQSDHRTARPSFTVPSDEGVWLRSALIVALMVAFGFSVKSLLGW